MRLGSLPAPAAFLCLAFIGLASPLPDLKSAMQAQMDLYVAAFKKKDTAAIESVVAANFAKDFVDVDIRGNKRTRDQWLAQLRQQLRMIRSVQRCVLKIESMAVKGNRATSMESMDLAATIPNMADPAKTSKLAVKASWSATYAKRNGKWWCVNSVAKTERVSIDGRPLTPAGGG